MNSARLIHAAALSAILSLAAFSTASAQYREHHDRRSDRHPRADERHWHGDIRHFGDLGRWRSGHWQYGRYHDRLGWWWIVGSLYYWYPSPASPYPDPFTPPAIVTQPGAAWYYCDAARAYYPYVAECPGGWRIVPATPVPTPLR